MTAVAAESRFRWEQISATFAADPTLARDRYASTLAQCRRAAGTEPMMSPDIWDLYTTRAPAALRAEHATLALYGVLQQGNRRPMHGRASLGAAAATLRTIREDGKPTGLDDFITRRLKELATRRSFSSTVDALTGLYRLLGGAGVAVDVTDTYYFLESWDSRAKRTARYQGWASDYMSRINNRKKEL